MSVAELAGSLERTLGNPASFRAVSTRVLLRTGVNLREPRPDQNHDSEIVTKVRQVLTEMGYRI